MSLNSEECLLLLWKEGASQSSHLPGDKHEEKEKVENVLVTSEVSERSPDNTKHVQLSQPVNLQVLTQNMFNQTNLLILQVLILSRLWLPVAKGYCYRQLLCPYKQQMDQKQFQLKFFWIVPVIALL